MAWFVKNKPLARYLPRLETVPSSQELWRARLAFGQAHPEMFPFRHDFEFQGVHLPHDLLPTSAMLVSGHKTPGDAFGLLGYGFSQRLKAVVEAVEPGIHQFVPVPVNDKMGARCPGAFFVAVIGNLATDQLDVESTRLPVMTDQNGTSYIKSLNPRDQDKVCIRRAATRGFHLWVSWDIHRYMTLSDTMKAAFDEARIGCFDYIRALES